MLYTYQALQLFSISLFQCHCTIDELKTHLLGRKTPIRSLKPREVVQEIYGLLLGHYAVRCLMFQAAQKAGISPLRLGFTGAPRSFVGRLVSFKTFNLNNSLFLLQVNYRYIGRKNSG